MKVAASLAVVPLPSPLKIPIYRHVFGYRVGRSVKIGWSWILVGSFDAGDGVWIGHFNRFKDIPDVRLGPHTIVGHLNTFVASGEFTNAASVRERGNQSRLLLGAHSSVTRGHYFDVNDVCEIGPFTVVAGVGSIVFTHYLDVVNSAQATRPVRVGAYCMLGAAVRLAPGAVVPDCSVVGMGTIVTGAFVETHSLIAGSPARIVRRLPEDAAFFHRTRGWIGQYAPGPRLGDDPERP